MPSSAEVTTPSSSGVRPLLVERVVQRDVPVGDDDEADPGCARRPQRLRHLGEGAEAQRRQQRRGQRVEVEPGGGRRQRAAQRLGRPAPQRRQRGAVDGAVVVGAVPADLGLHRRARLGRAQLQPEALAQLAPQRLHRRLQLQQRAEGVEQPRLRKPIPPARGHATNPQRANCAVSSPSSTALTATPRSTAPSPRSPSRCASHMWSGNSTARKRGRDISGCASTG